MYHNPLFLEASSARPKSMFAGGFEGRANLRSRHEQGTPLDKQVEKDETDGKTDKPILV